MADRNNPHASVPRSPGTNRRATQRTVVVTLVIVGFLMIAMWIPW